MKDITFEDILFVIFIILGIILIISSFMLIYDAIFIKDQITCLGGHTELRYNINTKTHLPKFICDSAKIIYK